MSECGFHNESYNEWLATSKPTKRQCTYAVESWYGRFTEMLQDWCVVRPSTVRVKVRPAESVEVRFYRLAAEWSHSTAHVSSTTAMTAHPVYQQIISLGWEVVPTMLADLRDNRRFWFPALAAITGVRPFDRRDAGNGRRMTEAWLAWGKKKGLI